MFIIIGILTGMLSYLIIPLAIPVILSDPDIMAVILEAFAEVFPNGFLQWLLELLANTVAL